MEEKKHSAQAVENEGKYYAVLCTTEPISNATALWGVKLYLEEGRSRHNMQFQQCDSIDDAVRQKDLMFKAHLEESRYCKKAEGNRKKKGWLGLGYTLFIVACILFGISVLQQFLNSLW